jgi:hypothetical protein
MRMERIESRRVWTELIIVRLIRRWVAAREQGLNASAGVVALAAELGVPAMAGIALDSLLQLTENCLKRPLRAECCCSPKLGPDERAVLLLIAAQPSQPPWAASGIPHGLPGALSWAAASLNRLLGEELPATFSAPTEVCPFERPRKEGRHDVALAGDAFCGRSG